MGLLEALIGAATSGQQNNSNAGGAPSGMDPKILMGIVGALMSSAGGVSGLLAKLQQGGLADAAQSWVGTGANKAVSPDAVGGALGPDLMGMIAKQMGGNSQQAAGTLAGLLPSLIDQLTPQGQVPADNGMGALGGLLGGGGGAGGKAGDLVGMLGGLLKR